MMPLDTFLSSIRFPPRSLGNKGRMPSTCSVLIPNNGAITHLLLMLSWGHLSGERIIPHMMGPDPRTPGPPPSVDFSGQEDERSHPPWVPMAPPEAIRVPAWVRVFPSCQKGAGT